MNRNTFSDKEQSCQSAFGKHRHWWHLYTLGKQTPLVFRTPQDFMFGINLLARCCDECQGITIVAFEIMSNHIHLVIAGEEEAVRNFFSHYHKRMARYFSSQGYGSIPDGFSLCLKAVPDLQSLRNVIAYVHRNGYVADPAVTPMSYPWGTGQFYFQLPRETKPASDLTYRQTREMFRTGEYKIPDSFRILDGHICPASFCAIGLGMAMFRDAHHIHKRTHRCPATRPCPHPALRLPFIQRPDSPRHRTQPVRGGQPLPERVIGLLLESSRTQGNS